MFCTRCGAQNPDDGTYCYKCGKQLYSPERVTSTNAEMQVVAVVSSQPNVSEPTSPQSRSIPDAEESHSVLTAVAEPLATVMAESKLNSPTPEPTRKSKIDNWIIAYGCLYILGALSLLFALLTVPAISQAKFAAALIQAAMWGVTAWAVFTNSKGATALVWVGVALAGIGAFSRGLVPLELFGWAVTIGLAIWYTRKRSATSAQPVAPVQHGESVVASTGVHPQPIGTADVALMQNEEQPDNDNVQAVVQQEQKTFLEPQPHDATIPHSAGGRSSSHGDSFEKIIALLLLGCVIAVIWFYLGYLRRPTNTPNRSATATPAKELAAAMVGDKWGYIDRSGHFAISPQFIGEAGSFSDGLAAVNEGYRLGYIGTDGSYVIVPQFSGHSPVNRFSEGLAAVQSGGLWGYVDKSGRVTIAPQFRLAFSFAEGLAAVCKGNKLGFIDPAGTFVVEPSFDCYPEGVSGQDIMFSEGLAAVQINGAWGYVDKHGKIVGLPIFHFARPFFGGLARVTEPGCCHEGFIDKTGGYVIKPQFDTATDFAEGLAAVKTGGKWGYINTTGKFAIKPQFEMENKADPFLEHQPRQFSEGLAAVQRNGKWGFIDRTGNYVIEPVFENVEPFSKGIAAVLIRKKWGYIDKRGKLVVIPQFEYVSDFSE